ncbi:MAG: CRISPR/Cas system-associated RNA-guided endonuclease Cas9, type II-B [Candidatus Campylobacter infans]|nr:MAG: CRISPR/Cas system-associated RNA-guided endonuclease Cas9, type II-B [Candidatus Campylobacter infans]
MKKFSINVDMGAKNNGVFLASVEGASAKITNKSAFNIKIDKGENFVLDRANRLAKRHTRRSFDRDCFVLRFAGQIFDLDKLPTRKELLEKIENQKIEYKKELKEPKELIFGLFKNRGFNYQNIKIKDEVFDDENFICLLEKFNCLKEYGYEFSECRCLEDFENFINQKADELSNSNSFKDDMLNFLNEQSKIINDIKEFYDITNNLSDKVLKNNAKAIEIAQKEINALGNDDENLANLQTKLENLQKNYPKFVEILKDKEFIEILKVKDEDKESVLKKFVKFFNELINAAKSELERNNKHRKAYLKDINKELNSSDNKILAWEYDEIFNNLRDKVEGKKWSKDEFYKFVGNVANIQTRVWRRYFNFANYKMPNFDKDKLKIYDDSKLAKQILRNFRDFRYEKKHEKDTFEKIKPIMQNLMKELKSKKEQKSLLALTFLKSTDPVLTIPPYESRINKNPRACNAMSIKPESKIITPNLTNITKKIFANNEFGFLLINENGEITTPDFNDTKITAKYLQRFLDISKSKLNDSDLYPRNLIQDNAQKIEIFKRFFALSDDEITKFVEFSKAYYDEVDSAKKGVVKGKILKICGLHTPHKHKNKAELISALFIKNIKNHGQISSEEFDKLCDFMQNTGEYKSKAKNTKPRKIAKFFEDLDEVRKSYQNAFFNEALNTLKALNENNDKNLDANLRKIVQDYEIIAKSIQENINFCKFQTPFEASNLATNLNYLLQLGDIIFSDKNAGFLKTCKEHTMENLLRSGGEAMASRLPSNSGKLINGKIEMYLDRLAYEIIKQSPKFDDFDEVEINVEMNKFAFEENAVAVGLKKQAKKTKNAKSWICPYSVKVENISESNCEYDHIIARNDKGFNIVFNSTANLIPCKSSANLEKSNKIYKLDDLHPKHLQSVFGTSNKAEIKDFISKNLATIDEKTYTNFYNLSKKEQIAFRYALFLREGQDFGKAVRLLNQDKIKGYSNGTQKRFVNLLIEKIKKLSKIQKFSVNFIDSKMLSATRTELSIMREDIRKQNIQDSHSHCIDASLVFHLVNSKLIKNSNSQREFLYDYFDEIYLSQSEIITPKNKQYLELKTNIARKRLFDDSVYSLVYEQCDNGKFISIKNLKILRDLGLLHTRKNGKKIQVPAGQAIDENALKKYFVSTHKVFDKIFGYFENKNIAGLEKLKFLDKYLKSYKREDITDIFGIGNDNKIIIKKEKYATPNITKFYQILKENEEKISRIEDGKVKIDENAIKSLYKQTFDKGEKRKRNKTRCVYSLSMIADNSQYVIRRNGGYMGLKGDKIAAKNYLFKNKKGEFDIQSVPFYSKNVLPKKISDILTILSLPKDALLVYDFTDIILAKISPKIMPENIAKHIAKLDFVISQAARHITRLYLRKNSFDDINFDELKDFTLSNKEFVKLYENYDNLFKSVLGTPRVEKQELSSAKILQNDSEILGFEYTASNSASFKALIKELLNETSSAK